MKQFYIQLAEVQYSAFYDSIQGIYNQVVGVVSYFVYLTVFLTMWYQATNAYYNSVEQSFVDVRLDFLNLNTSMVNLTQEIAPFRQEHIKFANNITRELYKFELQQKTLIEQSNGILESIKNELEKLDKKILDVISDTIFEMNIGEANLVDVTLDLCEYDPLGVGPIECEGGELIEIESNAVTLKPIGS